MAKAERRPLYEAIKTASRYTDEAVVAFSCGKDAIVTLDLCARYLRRVEAFFMYIVPGLEFQEAFLRYTERRYNIRILRIPHWSTGRMFKYAVLRHPNAQAVDIPTVKIEDIYSYVTNHFGIQYTATGEKRSDSQQRLFYIPASGVNEQKHRLYPLANWSGKQVFSYVRQHNLRLPADYDMFKKIGSRGSFDGLAAENLRPLRERYPEDYKRICEYFPFAGAVLENEEIRNRLTQKALQQPEG